MGAHSSDAGGINVGEDVEPTPQLRATQPSEQELKTPARPSMSEMLKGIGSVKLRTTDAAR